MHILLLHARNAFSYCGNFCDTTCPTGNSRNGHPRVNKTNLGQPPGCPERHTYIRIAPYDRVRRRKTTRVLVTHPAGLSGWGFDMSVSRGKHRLAHQSDVRRGCRQREPGQAIVTCPGGYSARPGLLRLRSRQAPSPSQSDCWPAYCRITISCGSYIDDRRPPVNSAALRDSRDSAPASRQAVVLAR